MDLNAATLTSNPTDIFSLIPLLGNNPVASTGLSITPAQDFSALLTEMTGPNPVPPAPAGTPVQHAAPVDVAPVTPEIANTSVQPRGKEPQKAQKAETTGIPAAVPFVPLAFNTSSQVSPVPTEKNIKVLTDAPEPKPATPVLQQVVQPELERAFADVKKFEFTVQAAAAPAPATLQQKDASDSAAVDPEKEALVATDPLVTVQQQQLPPRIAAIQKVVAEARPSERGRLNSSSTGDVTAPTPTAQAADLIRPAECIDQAAPANPIEIPNLPHLPVVRTVAMEVGDPGSQVTIHIQERGGNVAMQLNTASDPLHHDLQSSVGSLVQSLKQEQVPVSNVEVTRKSSIDKVRRMKEAQ
jgi:hypothetical protein